MSSRSISAALSVLLSAPISGPARGRSLPESANPPADSVCDDRLAAQPAPAIEIGPGIARPGYRMAELRFPSPAPSGNATNDTVRGELYLPDRAGRRPAAVVLHNLLALADARFEKGMAASLARGGYVAAFMELPYHLGRTPRGASNGGLFVSADLARTVEHVNQAAAEAAALVRWLSERPDVDPSRVAVVGVSIGGFLTHLVMGRDSRVRAGVAIVAGGDVAGLLWKSHAGVAAAVRERLKRAGIDRGETARRLAPIDPMTYAGCNAPRSVLLVNATDDLIVPRSSADAIARALGHPPQLWLPTNHFGIILFPDRLYRLTRDFLDTALVGGRFPRSRLRRYEIPGIRAGLFLGSPNPFGAGIAWPVVFSRGNRPAALVDGVQTFRGAFIALRLPVSPTLAVGIGRSLRTGRVVAYASAGVSF